MQKIMFNDEYGLTEAVLSGVKTMTRRIVKAPSKFNGVDDPWMKFHKRSGSKNRYDCMLYDHDGYELGPLPSRYKVGEEVAVAQRYSDIPMQHLLQGAEDPLKKYFHRQLIIESQGYKNKMFVSAKLMPHRIRITNIKAERLQEISDTDCIREGIIRFTCELFEYRGMCYSFDGDKNKMGTFQTPPEAFAALIDRVSRKGTWDLNPLVFVYEFELIK